MEELNLIMHNTSATSWIKNQIFIFIKYQILSLSKIKFYLYQKSNSIIIKNRNLSLSKITFYLYQISNSIFI